MKQLKQKHVRGAIGDFEQPDPLVVLFC